MESLLSFLLSLSVLVPFGFGVVRCRTMPRKFHPFVLLLGVGVLAEIASRLSILFYRTNAVVFNLYSLAECLIIFYLFSCWHPFRNPRKWILIGTVIAGSVWLTENLLYWHIREFSPVFRSFYAFVVVILSINEINYLIIHESRQLLRNARFVICVGFLIYFLYQILLEGALYVSNTEGARSMSNRIIWLSIYINIFTNILYAVAIWFIPARSVFRLPGRTVADDDS